MTLHFTATESTFSYFEALSKYLHAHGKPVAFYSDKASVFYVRNRSQTAGKGVTQFGRALYELNIDAFCANTSQAKGRVERANLTLQDRLVKELRLRGISTWEAANAYAPCFMADYNSRFAKPPRSTFDAHRPLRDDESLARALTWREARRVTKALTVQYDRVMYLLEDTEANRALIHRDIEVWEYPDGRMELHAGDRLLVSRQYDRLTEVDQGAVVECKRLAHVLELSQAMQAQRDNRSIGTAPSRTHRGAAVRAGKRVAGTKKQREFTQQDMERTMVALHEQKRGAQPINSKSAAGGS